MFIAALLSAGVALGAEPTLDELLNATDDVMRGQSSTATVSMHVKTRRYERTVRMDVSTRGTEDTLIVIVDPPKDKGTATLKVGENIWNYLPKVDRTIKVPASMMGGSWMGSHFTNDDLVKDNRLADEFDASITEKPDNNEEHLYVIDLTPKPEAPVVWGKLRLRIDTTEMPRDITYYDEDGTLIRTMSFSDVREFDGRRIPAVMRVVPADKPGEFTEVTYESLDFDVDLPDSTFTVQALRR